MNNFLCPLVTLEAVLKCLVVGSQTPGRLFAPRVFPVPLQIPDRSNDDSSCVTEKSTLTQVAAHDSCSPELRAHTQLDGRNILLQEAQLARVASA